MDLKEPQNIFTLLWEGLKLVNRSGSVLILFILTAVLLNAATPLLLHFGISSLLVNLYSAVCTAFLVVLLFRILAAKADNFGESFSNSLSASVFPTIYLLICNILLFIVYVVLVIVGAFLGHLLQFVGLGIAALLGAFFITRLIFSIPAIALKDQGPIQAILYSWNMTQSLKSFLKTFLTFFITSILSTLYILGVLRALYVVIPLYFADSFDITALTPEWYAVGIVCLLGLGVVWFWSAATFVLFFLNSDYGENRGAYTPSAQADLFSQQTQVFGADNNVWPANLGKPVRQEDVNNRLEIVQASVKTHSGDEQVQEHLSQVYQPKPEDFVEYKEEDRMPTILFDDDMAKQMEENHQMWAKKQETDTNKKDDEDDFGTIKMSK